MARVGCLGVQARVPDPSFGPITWVDPAGNNDYNGCPCASSTASAGACTSSTPSPGRMPWAIPNRRSNTIPPTPPLLRRISTICTPNTDLPASMSSCSTSRAWSTIFPVGKGRQYGGNMNPVLDGVLGGWQLTGINTANTGTPINVYYTPSSSQRRDRPEQRISRRGHPAAQRLRQRHQPVDRAEPPDLFRRLQLRDAAGQRSLRRSGPQRIPRARVSSNGTWAYSRTSPSAST